MKTIAEIRQYLGAPNLYVNGDRKTPVAAYVGPNHLEPFIHAGVQLYTFPVPGIWWVGPNQLAFSDIDAYLHAYIQKIPDGYYFMPRINLSRQGYPWWGQSHPDEMNVLRSIKTGEILDQLKPNPAAIPYLGHEIILDGMNLHSFHSKIWRTEAGDAVYHLIEHCESQTYADRIWGWHLCDGLFNEWFHWNEYAFEGMADYSEAAQKDFKQWLKITYHDDESLLSGAWGMSESFDTATIPGPASRNSPARGEFFEPVLERPIIDYTQCFNDAIVESILTVCQAAKCALHSSKVVCVFYGYQFSNMPRPQLNGHYALGKILTSPAVDILASPHAYGNRGEGGYHSPQSLSDSIRRAGKIHFDEIDSKTIWTPESVTWKRHISQPQTISSTIEMMKKDAAYQLASNTAQWWMDLTDQGWFDAPEAAEAIRKLMAIEEHLQTIQRATFGEVAFVVSQRAMMYQAPREGLHNFTLKIFRNWHLSRMGAPFEQILIQDLARTDLPNYKLYIFPNAFYINMEERNLIHTVLKRSHACALWIYAPGYIDDSRACLDNMHQLTGIRFGLADQEDELNIKVFNDQHPITADLPLDFNYGTGIRRDTYLTPPKIQYLPESKISPIFYVADTDVVALGFRENTNQAGLVVKHLRYWQSIYSSAPITSWVILRNIARWAGVHIYAEKGDMLWGNNAFLAIYSQSKGERTIFFPRAYDVTDAYTGEIYGQGVNQIKLKMDLWETRLLYTSDPVGSA